MRSSILNRPTLILTQKSQIVQLLGDIRMVFAQHTLPNLQSSLAQRLRLLVTTALAIENGQIVESCLWEQLAD